jgi:hypothetical protein
VSISEDGEEILCDGMMCKQSVPNHKWGKIKEGKHWFFSSDDKEAYCSAHLPKWAKRRKRMRVVE